MFGYDLVKTTGHSMSPAVLHGAYLLIKRRKKYIDGDIVYVNHAKFGKIVKRIISGNKLTGFYLAGDNVSSVSMEQLGIVPQSHIIGIVRRIINPSS